MQDLYGLRMDFLNQAFDDSFTNIKVFFLFYLVALAVFWFRKNKELKSWFVYPALFALITVFNPYLMVPIADKIGLAPRIRRIYWLLPVNLVLAFALVWLTYRLTRHWQRALFAAAFTALIALVGESQLSYMVPAQNIYKVSQETIEIAAMIEEDAKGNGAKSCLYADVSLLELRQYDASILNTIRRKDMTKLIVNPADPASVQQVLDEKNSRRTLSMVLYYGVQVKPSIFKKYAKKYQIQYVIPNKDKGLGEYLELMGYQALGETEHFVVYKAT